ncbi:MAG: cell wall-binding repeat-containing protein [Acidimicrobiaceae bacterium]|nr:cell wall-binding repeat-containing protein [Acidimicrobiaceae bacterium]
MRRLGLTVLALLVGLGGVLVLPATAAGAAETDGSDVSVTRYGGADRYVTSLQVAEAVAADAGGSLSSVVLVSGRRWTDAVVAAPVAGGLGAPVLMTPPDELRADALEFLQRVGVSSAVVVGPDASGGRHGPGRGVGAGVLEALEAAGISTERVAGDDRFGTSVAAARRVTPGAMGALGATAVIASGEVFADALVAGPIASRGIHPVLLSSPGELHAGVGGYLSEAGISHVVLMGGTAALSEAVEQSIKDLGIDVSRVAGSTRYDTAVKAAGLADGRYSDAAGEPCFDTATIGVARARVPFDSFSAAPLLGRLCAPLVLADPGQIPADTAAFLDTARDAHDALGLQVFGGDAAVSQAAIDAYLTGEEPYAGENDEAKDDGEDGEELSTAPGVLPAGTCGGAIDDEPVQLVPSTGAEDPSWSPDCSRLVYNQDGSLWTVNNDGTDAQKLVHHDSAYLHSPVWSPDGTRIAYVRGQNDENGHWLSHIWTVNIDGSHNNQRTEGDQIDRWPAWSPDSSKIAFERESGSGRDEHGHRLDSDRYIVVMTAFGNNPKALNEGDRWEHSPAWSPDGAQLAYETDGYVVVSDPDGGNARRLHAGVYFNGGLSWSPDGKRMAFTRGNGTKTSIVVADVDGIAEEVVFDEAYARSPRGGRQTVSASRSTPSTTKASTAAM